jgi:hypothetical protein
MKKVSDVFKSIRFAKGEPRGKKHLSTDDEEHGTVGEMDFDQQLAHAKKRAMQEDLRNWFNPNHPEGDWKRVNSKGEVVGDCAREPGEPKPKCMSKELRNSLTKKEKASAVRRKRKEDPNPERQGAPINVTNKVNEDMEQLDEKNKPTNPELWSRAIAQAKSKFDVYPSAYANGWASKWYKSKGGGWKSVSEDVEQIDELSNDMLGRYKSAAGADASKADKAGDYNKGNKRFSGIVKATKKQLANDINNRLSTVKEAKEKSEYDYEGDMARGQLQSIVNNAQRVHDMLEDNDNLPEWVQSKITLAEDYISTVANYMMSEVDEEVVVEGKGLWANIRAKRERIKNGSGERMRKPGSEGAPSEEILKKTQAIKEEHLEEGRTSQRHPLEGHEYHKKTDAELVYIAKDAHKAAEAMKSHNTTAENKYRDQANDSATVRYYRKTHGMADWYKKKYGHIKESDASWAAAMEKQREKRLTTGDKKKLDQVRDMLAKEKKPVKEEVKDEYARKVDKYLKKKHGKDDSQKKLPQGASFAAARRKARLASNGRMDEALSPAIRMQMALQKAKEDRERSERNGEAAMAGKFSSGPAKQPMKNPSLVSPKNEEVIVEDNVINKEPKLPFDEPTTKARGTVKDKSGAEHTSMSRVKDLAKKAARKQAGIKEAADVNDPLDRIDTPAKRSLSRTAGMVKDLATNAKAKAKEKSKKDTFEAEPELSSQIMKQD